MLNVFFNERDYINLEKYCNVHLKVNMVYLVVLPTLSGAAHAANYY